MVTLLLKIADPSAPFSRVMTGLSYSKIGIVHGVWWNIDHWPKCLYTLWICEVHISWEI